MSTLDPAGNSNRETPVQDYRKRPDWFVIVVLSLLALCFLALPFMVIVAAVTK